MTDSATAKRSARLFRPLILVPILALITLVFWGLSSPVGASPDDDFHMASIWCATGNSVDACEPGTTAAARDVPKDLVVASKCFAGNPNASASCQGDEFGTTPSDTTSTARGNYAVGLYPPIYYLAMRPFVSANIDVSVVLMRLANSVLFVALASFVYFLLPARRKPTLAWSLVISMVPFGMFLVPSTNPSGWAILSAGTLWISLLGYFETSGRRKVGLGAAATIATLIGAGARADAAVYAGLAIVIVVFLSAKRSKSYLLSLILPLVLMAVAILFYRSAEQSSAAATGGGFDVNQFVSNFLHVPGLWVGAFGGWGLGWLDTAMDPVVWVLAFGAFCGVLFLGLGARVKRKGIAAGVVFVALWLVPTVVLTQAHYLVGDFVQPRYILPLIVLLGGLALLQRTGAELRPTISQLVVVIGALAMANALALHANIRRYVTGTDVSGVNLDRNVEWWWNLPISPMFVWVAGSLAFAALLIILGATWRTKASATTTETLDRGFLPIEPESPGFVEILRKRRSRSAAGR